MSIIELSQNSPSSFTSSVSQRADNVQHGLESLLENKKTREFLGGLVTLAVGVGLIELFHEIHVKEQEKVKEKGAPLTNDERLDIFLGEFMGLLNRKSSAQQTSEILPTSTLTFDASEPLPISPEDQAIREKIAADLVKPTGPIKRSAFRRLQDATFIDHPLLTKIDAIGKKWSDRGDKILRDFQLKDSQHMTLEPIQNPFKGLGQRIRKRWEDRQERLRLGNHRIAARRQGRSDQIA